MLVTRKLGVLFALAAVLGFASLAFADDHWSGGWKVAVDGKSSSSGTIGFKLSFEPDDEGATRDPITVDAPIPEKKSKNDVAELVTSAFQGVLGEDDFKIDRSWGNNVKISARGKTPDFVLEIAGNTVQGISLVLDD